jgi:hypothetical protein
MREPSSKPQSMTTSISKAAGEVYAFCGNAHQPCAMVHGTPVVEAMFDVVEVQKWITTLEEVRENAPVCHYGTLSMMIARLQVVLDNHDRQHQQVMSSAPTAEDQMAYLASYLKALKAMAPKEAV